MNIQEKINKFLSEKDEKKIDKFRNDFFKGLDLIDNAITEYKKMGANPNKVKQLQKWSRSLVNTVDEVINTIKD